jgi:hypothetical protein
MRPSGGYVSSLTPNCLFCVHHFCSSLLPSLSQAQLTDPNNRCYYAPGSTVWQSLPAPAPPQQSKARRSPQGDVMPMPKAAAVSCSARSIVITSCGPAAGRSRYPVPVLRARD